MELLRECNDSIKSRPTDAHFRRESRDVMQAILSLARERDVTQIVVGRSTRSRWQEIRDRSLTTELIREARGHNILVVAHHQRR